MPGIIKGNVMRRTKKVSKRLALTKETVRRLHAMDLRHVAGASGPAVACTNGCTADCTKVCPPFPTGISNCDC